MNKFIPDENSYFYVTAKPIPKILNLIDECDVIVGMDVTNQDKSFDEHVFSCLTTDTHMVIAKRHHGDMYINKIVKFPLERWNFAPVGPDVLKFLKTLPDWRE